MYKEITLAPFQSKSTSLMRFCNLKSRKGKMFSIKKKLRSGCHQMILELPLHVI